MLIRRLVLLALILAGLGAIAAAIAPRDGGFTTLPPPADTQPQPPPPPPEETQTATTPTQQPQATDGTRPPAPQPPPRDTHVVATLPPPPGASDVVEARVGQVIRLTVEVDRRTTVRIEGRAGVENATPNTPARFDFVARTPGRFPVVRADQPAPIGTVVIVSQ